MLRKLILGALMVTLTIYLLTAPRVASFRTWRCVAGGCVKENTSTNKVISISECKARCLEFGGLWPKPRGPFRLGNRTSQVDATKISFEAYEYPEAVDTLLTKAQRRFLSGVKGEDDVVDFPSIDHLHRVAIRLDIYDPSITDFSTGTDESYSLRVFPPTDTKSPVRVTIQANTFFGLRHGLETLSQLFFYDDVHKVHKIMNDAFVDDKPEFTHRGIALDTGRSYVSVSQILKILDGMAINKLNTFHWHITDSQSFPYVSTTYPELSENGAYSEQQVYTQGDIKNIVEEARSLGIRVLPEFDAPAHVGEGWSALGTDLVTCFKWQPWSEFCVEPPCGQLNPTNERVYHILGNIFKEFVDLFQSDLFHMGGDEVNINCWRSTQAIRDWMKKSNYSETNEGYLQLWARYQAKALAKLRDTKSDPHPQPVLWSSTLTQPAHIDHYLSPQDYIIQVWTHKTDLSIKALIEKKFRLIFSNYDELYFDCGGPSWVGRPGQNWCSPYIGWQNVYLHSPYGILREQGLHVHEDMKKLVLGSEAALWTEQLDGEGSHARLWPRGAALAERLWSNPTGDWTQAQFRMNHHRERMKKTVSTELLQPLWCYQNDGEIVRRRKPSSMQHVEKYI